MYFNDVNFALGLMFAAFSGAGSTENVWAYWGFLGDGRCIGTMQNVVGPTLVAMETKFWQIWATFFTKRL